MHDPAIFLDRDGTLIHEKNYSKNPADIEFFQASIPLLGQAQLRGYKLVVVSNQAGVAQGFMTEVEVQHFNRTLALRLNDLGVTIHAMYYCPHHPEKGLAPYQTFCDCRKPQPGMLLRAACDLSIDLSRSWMIGDRRTDLEAGWNAGCKSILVKTGYGVAAQPGPGQRQPEFVAEDLAEALRRILE